MTCYMINPQIEFMKKNDTYIIDLKGEYYYINEISYYILQFCKQKHTLQEIIDYIVNTYDVDVNLVTDDMKNIVQEFVNCGILFTRGDNDEKI